MMMIKMKIWKRLGIFTLLGLLLSWVVSCSFGSVNPAKSGGSQIEFWTMQLQPEYTDYFKQLISTFEKQNPGVQVRWVDVPWSAMESKILTAVAGKTAPDVVNLNPDFASQLAGQNAWLDLDAKVPAQVRDVYLPNVWKASSLNGKTFGIPWYITTKITIYNQDLLQKAGVSKPTVTYEDLARVAKQVKEKTGKYAFFITFVPGDSGEVLESFVEMGVNLLDAQGKAAFNTAQGKAVFHYWVDLYKNGLLPKDVLTQGHRRAIELYQSGETALLATGAEFLKQIENNAPTIAKVSRTAPQITGSTGKKNIAVMNLVVNRESKFPDLALKFALFVTNDENQLSFAKAANVLPSTVKALQDNYFKSLPPNPTPSDQARLVSASQMKEAEVLIPALKNINRLQKLIYENLQAAMLNQKTVDQAIADAANGWEHL